MSEVVKNAIPEKGRTRIVIMVDWFYPGYKAGGPIQSCVNFVNAFLDEYELYVITSDRDLGDHSPYAGIEVNQWNNYKEKVKVYYGETSRLNYATLKSLLLQINPDLIYLNSMYSFRFAILPMIISDRGLSSKMILAPRGMLQQGAMQSKSAKKKLFILALRATGIPKRISFHATDEQEAIDIKASFPRNNGVTVISNFPKTNTDNWKEVKKEVGKLRMIFVSRVAEKKNLLYALECLGQLGTDLEISFDVYGVIDGEEYWSRCQKKMATLPKNIVVNYKGAIPNDEIASLYRNYHLFVLPTLGENFGHAIFEALTAGKPVLISNKTPWRDLEKQQTGFDIDLSDRSKFIAAIEQFAKMDQNNYNQWSENAWKFAKAYQSSSGLKEKYLNLFRRHHN